MSKKINLWGNTSNQTSEFRTKNLFEINDVRNVIYD